MRRLGRRLGCLTDPNGSREWRNSPENKTEGGLHLQLHASASTSPSSGGHCSTRRRAWCAATPRRRAMRRAAQRCQCCRMEATPAAEVLGLHVRSCEVGLARSHSGELALMHGDHTVQASTNRHPQLPWKAQGRTSAGRSRPLKRMPPPTWRFMGGSPPLGSEDVEHPHGRIVYGALHSTGRV